MREKTKRMRIIALSVMAIVSIVGVMACAVGCNKGEDWEYIAKKGTIVVGIDAEYPPYTTCEAKKNYLGFDIDLAIRAGMLLGVDVKFKAIEWKDKIEALNDKKIDVIWGGLSITEERKRSILFSKPYLDTGSVIIVKKGGVIKEMSDLAKAKVGILEASSQYEWALANTEITNERITVEKNNGTIVEDLLLPDKVDAIFIDKQYAEYYLQHFDKENKLVILPELLAPSSCGVGMRQGDVELASRINQAIDTLERDGDIAISYEKWFGKDYRMCP